VACQEKGFTAFSLSEAGDIANDEQDQQIEDNDREVQTRQLIINFIWMKYGCLLLKK